MEKISGTEKIGELLEEFENKDFNMDEFDKKMNDIFNKEYYNQELDDEEIEKFDAKQEKYLKLEEKEENKMIIMIIIIIMKIMKMNYGFIVIHVKNL